jgi:ribosome biogenesis GTPase A
MTKTKRQIMRDIALVDVVLELLDARVPGSSRNPDISELSGGKKRIIILNKADLADEGATARWTRFYENMGFPVIAANSASSASKGRALDAAAELMRGKIEKNRARGRLGYTTRAIVLGIPNVGKSTLINHYAKRSAAAAADRPGVTRGKQWIKVNEGFELLDTPGILWPKLDDPECGVKLAATGAIKDNILDMTELATRLAAMLREAAPGLLEKRYKITPGDNEDVLARIGEARGFKLKGGVIDIERAAATLIDEYRGGVIGRATLELP